MILAAMLKSEIKKEKKKRNRNRKALKKVWWWGLSFLATSICASSCTTHALWFLAG